MGTTRLLRLGATMLAVLAGPTQALSAQAQTQTVHRSAPATSPFPRLSPYTATAHLTFRSLWLHQVFPDKAVPYAGQYEFEIHETVRDDTHWRVDIRIMQPALLAGTYTAVAGGGTYTTYDSRTDVATISHIPAAQQRDADTLQLAMLRFGTPDQSPWLMQVFPNPRESVKTFIGRLGHPDSKLGGRLYVKLLRQEQVAGRLTDVIDLHPMVITGTTCAHGRTAQCYFKGAGHVLLWIDHQRPFLLKEQQIGSITIRNKVELPVGLNYEVQNVQYGTGPTAGDLAYIPPVHPTSVSTTPLSGASEWTAGGTSYPTLPAPFSLAPSPETVAPSVSTSEMWGDIYGAPPHTEVEFDQLWTDGKATTPTLPGTTIPGMGYATGRYLLIQQRLQASGLPQELRTGTPVAVGKCQAWTGTFAGGPTWLAFAVGKDSVLLSSDTLSQADLEEYARGWLCS